MRIKISKKNQILLSFVMCFAILISYGMSVVAALTDIYPFNAGSVSANAEIILWPRLTSEYVEGGDGNPYNQRSYYLPYVGAGNYNEGCAVVCMAVGKSILDKKSHGPREFMKYPNNNYDATSKLTGLGSLLTISSSNQRSRLKQIYDAVDSGKPVRFFIGINSSDSGHFVLITGYFMCQSKLTARRYLKMFLEVIFYSWTMWFVLALSGYETLNCVGALKRLFFYDILVGQNSGFVQGIPQYWN